MCRRRRKLSTSGPGSQPRRRAQLSEREFQHEQLITLKSSPGSLGRELIRWRAAGLGRAAEELGVLRQRESLERSDEENLKEECSSTESTHHEVRGWGCPGCAVPCRAVLTCPSAA